MKVLTGFMILCFTTSTWANISLKIDFKNRSTSFNEKIDTRYDEVKIFKITQSNMEIEVMATDRIPEFFLDGEQHDEQVLVEMKVYETSTNGRKLITSPKVITVLGKEATLETYEDEARKSPLMTLRVTPARN